MARGAHSDHRDVGAARRLQLGDQEAQRGGRPGHAARGNQPHQHAAGGGRHLEQRPRGLGVHGQALLGRRRVRQQGEYG